MYDRDVKTFVLFPVPVASGCNRPLEVASVLVLPCLLLQHPYLPHPELCLSCLPLIGLITLQHKAGVQGPP
jgi:hypothetical protein